MSILTTMLGTPAQSFDGAVTISGAATLKSTLSVSGAAIFKTTATFEGATVCKTTLNIEGATTLSGAATFMTTQTVSGAAVFKTSATIEGTLSASATANFNVGVKIAGTTLFTNYTEGTFTPTVTLVGGAGNTVPVYTTNSGRYTRVGNKVFVDVYLNGDGGNEGAGTGQVNIDLPIASSANFTAGGFMIGTALNNTAYYILTGVIGGSASTIQLSYFNLISTEANFTGADQNNATRTIRLQFSYEV